MILATVGDTFGYDVRFAINGKERAPWTDVPASTAEKASESTRDAMARAYGVDKSSVTILEAIPIIAEPLSFDDVHEYLFKVKDVVCCAICGISDTMNAGEFTRIHRTCCYGNSAKTAERRLNFMRLKRPGFRSSEPS